MHRKIIVFSLVLAFFGASSAVHSLGLGLSFGGRGAFGGTRGFGAANTMLSLKLDNQDFLLGIGADQNSGLAATADWWLVQKPLEGIINYYAGPGGYLGISSNSVDAGLRIPFGLNIYPIDPLELFVEIAPAIGVNIDPFRFPTFGWQTALGFRFWF